MSAKNSYDSVETFRVILENEGITSALRFLNARTSHRFTSIYRFDGLSLQNIYLLDRQNPKFGLFPDARLEESYCSIVKETAATFSTLDSLHDARVVNHPKREVVLSYCGIPLVRRDGTMFGTLCHFDFLPQMISDAEIKFLETIAPHLLRELEK